ncbi:synaptosomal-associated protein 25 isoform X2 [Lingula anatina]|uniref:Synaptosomal-associated protein n=1 Tax=Lingula anatina TaxID=7574 RepID=A0A1S3K0G6_LINAN|nr:synaptosomal-associated protein 25 isoform X2 [Lingula anatina]|eukprot:XP_013416123.1 synaptosomal-associated protein 25 isoform X2 [Lingula anatina]
MFGIGGGNEEEEKAKGGPEGEPLDPEASEGEVLMKQIDDATNESLESTRRMLSLCEESQDVGIKTLVMLDEQGEQLDKIEEGMDEINRDMKEAEQNLEGLEKCCGLCVLPWKKTKSFEKGGDYNATWKASEDGQVNSNGPRVQAPGEQVMIGGNYVTRITKDAREDEMEQNISEVAGMIGNLKNMAYDMGNEIDNQNRQVDRINQKATSNEVRINEANKRANKLLKN